jgi:hypothetical protein
MGRRRSIRDWRENGSRGWFPVLGTLGFNRPLCDPRPDLRLRLHGSKRDARNLPTAEMHDRDQDAETVLAALRMTSRTTSGFDSMGT